MKYWKEENNRLCADFEFADFTEAFGFMSQVAIVAEKNNHHPNWSNVWNQVHFELNTHDAGGIVTQKDHDLARAINTIYERMKGAF